MVKQASELAEQRAMRRGMAECWALLAGFRKYGSGNLYGQVQKMACG
jgi:hypothetical protein